MKGVSSAASGKDAQSGKCALPLHSMLEPQMLQNFLIIFSGEG